jgi:UDP-4-amino-4,6-dideoxy-N-acetyl-beta-L-altrosamine transaminase
LIPYGRQSINFWDVYEVVKQLRFHSLTQGQKTLDFEQYVAEYCGAKYAVAVSNATAGLQIALKSLDLEENSTVATSPISFVASSNSILYNNLKPYFVDIDLENGNISIEKLTELLQEGLQISAIVPVHFAGQSCNMSALKELARKYNFKIIEDAAHALGGQHEDGSKVGSCKFSDLTVFSMHPVKSITSGEGGIITTNNKEIYLKLLRLRSHGINKLDDRFVNQINSQTNGETNLWYYEMIQLGYNFRLTDIQSALALSQIKRLDRFVSKRRKIANKYFNLLKNIKHIKPLIQINEIEKSALHIFVLNIDFTKLNISRNQLMKKLRNKGIGSQVHYIPIPMQPYYRDLGFEPSDYPNAMHFYNSTLSIPIFPKLKKRNVKKICAVLKEVVRENSSDL